jgi:hypothetical protein
MCQKRPKRDLMCQRCLYLCVCQKRPTVCQKRPNVSNLSLSLSLSLCALSSNGCTCVCVCVCTYVCNTLLQQCQRCVSVCIYAYMYVCVCVCVCMYVCICVCVYKVYFIVHRCVLVRERDLASVNCVQRDLVQCQKRPSKVSKET